MVLEQNSKQMLRRPANKCQRTHKHKAGTHLQTVGRAMCAEAHSATTPRVKLRGKRSGPSEARLRKGGHRKHSDDCESRICPDESGHFRHQCGGWRVPLRPESREFLVRDPQGYSSRQCHKQVPIRHVADHRIVLNDVHGRTRAEHSVFAANGHHRPKRNTERAHPGG